MIFVRLTISEQADIKMAHILFAVRSEPQYALYISSVSHTVSRMNTDVQEGESLYKKTSLNLPKTR